MNTENGIHFDGRQPTGSAATLIWQDQQARLIGERTAVKQPTGALKVSPRIGSADRFISFPDGSQLQCADSPLLDSLPQESWSEGPVAWLEQRWAVALVAIVLTLALLGTGYVKGMPRLAKFAAARIPVATERNLGNTTLNWLDGNGWFAPTKLDMQTQTGLRTGFADLVRGLPLEANYRLEFREGPRIGANALALPGGTIVITDEMVKLTRSPEEVMAVLAHEIGHVELRHALRGVLQDSAVAAAVSALTADAATLGTAVAGLPMALAQTRYSREFETEADDYAFALLKRHQLSPAHFANVMERLEQSHKGKDGGGNLSFLSSHPPTPERIRRAREADPGR